MFAILLEIRAKKLPHLMPSARVFAATMDAVHIRNDDHLVVYGQKGCPLFNRAWFQLIAMGHNRKKVHLVVGSLQSWIDTVGPIDTKSAPTPRVADLDLTKEPKYQAIKRLVTEGSFSSASRCALIRSLL